MSLNPFSNLPIRYRKQALDINTVVTRIVATIGTALLVYLYGFNHTARVQRVLTGIAIGVLVVFVISYVSRWLFTSKKTSFLKKTKWEIAFLVLAVVSVLFYLVANTLFSSLNLTSFYLGLPVSVSLLLLIFFEASQFLFQVIEVKVRPSVVFVASFLLLIVVGTGLLMLPAMSTVPNGLSVIDAFFMSTSASCVTGLAVIDTATDLTTRGQLVILGLFQIGGLGILAFAAFFTSLLNAELRIHQAKMIPDYLDGETLGSARSLLKRIVFLTVFIEAGTFIAMMYLWGDYPFSGWGERIFFSFFHAASAFCNAGFSLFSQGFYEPVIRDMYVLHAITSVAIVLGSLGFATLNNIFSPQQLRQRLEKPWIDWHLSTKIAVNTTIILLIVGTLGFYWLEKSNTLSGINLTESLISSFFQSATARTAGFNTVDISQITVPAMVLLIFLMFIGGSSGSTAGGIKTSTFFLLVASVISTSRGSSQIEIGNRHISSGIVSKALSIFFYGIAINLIGVFILSISESQLPLVDITFEQVSAFGTVGLSRGITTSLSSVGKIVIIATMFLGRVGTLTFAIALSTRAISQNYKLPEEELMVG